MLKYKRTRTARCQTQPAALGVLIGRESLVLLIRYKINVLIDNRFFEVSFPIIRVFFLLSLLVYDVVTIPFFSLPVKNLAEAEYSVALYMYMRLLGYPADRISILTTYNGQKHLIRDVINQRCAGNPFFSQPNKVKTLTTLNRPHSCI